ncbi:hypothetical protein PT974_11312 [Cladobotryum mycophilum]|uniref:Uncharacterized protein n=1 Tax=Cladobotryum mycophilum TaxID=491253 RepID=A0ABR0S4V2_9HYPO
MARKSFLFSFLLLVLITHVYRFSSGAATTAITSHDRETALPKELRLKLRAPSSGMSEAIDLVNEYLPVPNFDISPRTEPSTTVVSGFFPPPGENLVRANSSGTFWRENDAYLDGLKLLAAVSQYLVVFVPPGNYAEAMRNLTNVLVLDHYSTPWDMPHLKGRKDVFYGRQAELSPLTGGPYGEPHSWGAWNSKAFMVMEAIQLDPFRTSHFAWLDCRVPSMAMEYSAQVSEDGWKRKWPLRAAMNNVYNTMPADRAVLSALKRPLRKIGTKYWPEKLEDGTMADAFMTDIHAICANLFFGTKGAMARLSRALLVLLERDLARGYFVGREEFQMSYAHFEFMDLVAVVEVFRQKPDYKSLFHWVFRRLGDPDTDWSGLGLEQREPTME